MNNTSLHHDRSMPHSGLEKTGTLDAFVHDKDNDQLILAMFELRPWNLGELQLFQLQEKLNAYLSFILDGEMEESFPHLVDKPVRIELRTLHEPTEEVLGFLQRVKDQITHQQIELEIVLIEEQMDGCRCNHQGAECCGGPSMLSVNQQSCCQEKNETHCCQEKKQTACCRGTHQHHCCQEESSFLETCEI
ncbi:MAG: hypothetical protein FJ390_01890 [Verrucomicrobia bacterium]|nr:hypothetical protein [Verrucomicrobiota bacterium]